MEINRSNILEIVNKSNARPDKDYGQNFLVEPVICQKIVDSLDVQENEKVLEIGPGLGSLTHFLAKTKGHVTAIDVDERMTAFLKILYGECHNVDIVLNDIRKQDVSTYDKIIGNLPYNITSEVITYLLLNASTAKKIVLMVQADAFPHFNDINGKEYGPISVLLHLLGNCKKDFQVKGGSFYPVPKCHSVVFEINYSPVCELKEAANVYYFAKNLFLNRRKTISNNLMNLVKNKDMVMMILNECSIKENARPEDISPKEYLKLFRTYQIKLSKK